MAATETGTRAARTVDDLYRRHVSEVYRYAFAVLGNHADAEDVTQTTFVNALRALERGERPRTPGNWLLAIEHNIIRQRWRREHVRPAEVELDADLPDGRETDDDGPALADVVRALQRIPPAQREAIVMRELEGRSYREIAEILGLSTGALETLLFRARRSLADELENLVTCDRTELAMSRQLDGRASRKERRRLETHLRECPSCARFASGQRRHRKALRGLALLPLPVTLTFWKGAPAASAAASLPAIGLGTGAAGGGAAAGAGAAGGLALGGGVALKVAAVVAAVGVTGGVSYEGVRQLQQPDRAQRVRPVATQEQPPPTTSAPRASGVARARASSASALANPRVIPGREKAAAAKTRARQAKGARVGKLDTRLQKDRAARGARPSAARGTPAAQSQQRASQKPKAKQATPRLSRTRQQALAHGKSKSDVTPEPRAAKELADEPAGSGGGNGHPGAGQGPKK